MTLFTCLILALLVSHSHGYASYRSFIPNGNSVPDPCNPTTNWEGVGHNWSEGGGARNQFGKDFKQGNAQWANICSIDSDGDGLTNGEELGDPNCVWSQGAEPQRRTNISHPGVCNPINSPGCRQYNQGFVNCLDPLTTPLSASGQTAQPTTVKPSDIHSGCQTIKSAETRSLDLRLPSTEVPDSETTYICMTFDLPSDQDYHIKAFEAIKDNINVIHHILIYGCENADSPLSGVPGSCNMEDCETIIGLWAFGVDDTCYEEDIGFRFGSSSFKRVKLELHWNNPTRHSGWRDSSGMTIYYQPARPEVQDMLSFTTGQQILQIPPNEPTVKYVSRCNDFCTQAIISKPAYVALAINHMHYLGKHMSIQVFRDGKLLKNLTNEPYNYDSPTATSFQPHFQVLPGDEIKTTCVFNSMGRDTWTYYGDGTNDEMCFGFLMMYPADAFPHTQFCISHGPLDPCEMYAGTPISSCDWKTFLNFSTPTMKPVFEELRRNCNLDGFCRPECRLTSQKLREDSCMTGEAGQVVKYFLQEYPEGVEFLSRVFSCPDDNASSNCPTYNCPAPQGGPFDSATTHAPLPVVMLASVVIATILSRSL